MILIHIHLFQGMIHDSSRHGLEVTTPRPPNNAPAIGYMANVWCKCLANALPLTCFQVTQEIPTPRYLAAPIGLWVPRCLLSTHG